MRAQKNEDVRELTGEELERYIGMLRDGDNFDKDQAIDALIASPGRQVVEGIIPLLQEANTPVRMAVLDVLKKIGSVHLDGVIGMLDDANEDIRVYACEVLSFLSDPRSIPAMAKKARDDEENVRNAACMALGDFNDGRAVDALLEALGDVEWIAFSAIMSLGRIRSPRAIPRLMQFFRETSDELSVAACEVLIDYGDDAVLDELLEVLKGWDSEKRSPYLKIILENGNEETFERLKEKIGDELYEHLLGSIPENIHRPVELVRMLAHFRTPETCRAILGILRGIEPDDERYPDVLEHFASLADVWSADMASYIALDDAFVLPLVKACTIAGTKIDEAVLLELFMSAPMEVKREIVMNIQPITVGDGLTIIREALRDTDGHIKGFAVEAAGNLRLTGLTEDIAAIARKDFQDVRVKAMKALIHLDEARALEMIAEFVEKGSAADKKVYLSSTGLLDGEKNLPCVTRLLWDEDESVRRSAIGVVGNFTDNERYVELLEKPLMSDAIPHEVLKVIKDKRLSRFRDRLVGIFEDETKEMWTRYYALSALGAFEDPGLFDIFVKGLKDKNGLITIGCIRALADINDVRAMDHIRPYVENTNDDIRSAAEMVMSKMQS